MKRPLSPRVWSYILLGSFLVLAAHYRLGPAILTGLFCYTLLRLIHRILGKRLRPLLARYLSLAVFLVALFFVGWMFVKFIRQSFAAIPSILTQLVPVLNELSTKYGFDVRYETIHDLQFALMMALRENAGNITRSSTAFTVQFFKILVAGFAAVFYFMDATKPRYETDFYDSLRKEVGNQIGRFIASFERVMGAQVLISAINTVLTSIFLLVLGFPHVMFLVLATFMLGLLPIVGNLISNTLIVATALTISPQHALFALAFLVGIHKGEYFLNSKIVGSNVDMPMWKTLIAILVGEVILGLAGIPLAPAILHYIAKEMRRFQPDSVTPRGSFPAAGKPG